METFSVALFVGSLIVAMTAIQIAIIMFNDNKVWKKMDRLVLFFSNEKLDLIDQIRNMNDKLEKIEEKLHNIR